MTAAQHLSAVLRSSLERAGVSGRELARRTGFSQAKVSRLLKGDFLPSLVDAGRIGWALRSVADAELRRHILELTSDAHEERAATEPLRMMLQTGVANLQRRILRWEAESRHVVAFHPSIVPGLVQCDALMRAIYASSGADPDGPQGRRWMTNRRARQQQMAEPDRSCLVLLTEGCLRQPAPTADVPLSQCEHLIDLIHTRPRWRIGIIPSVLGGAQPLYPQNGFDLYETRVPAVMFGTTAGLAFTTDERVVARHRAIQAKLEAVAVYDDEAVAVLGGIADSYRATSVS